MHPTKQMKLRLTVHDVAGLIPHKNLILSYRPHSILPLSTKKNDFMK